MSEYTPKVIIGKDATDVCLHVARKIATAIIEFKPTLKKPYLVLGLPTGGTPIPMYQELVRLHKEKGLSFKNVVTFNMDEYRNLDFNHPESYHAFMARNLFDHIDIKKENIHILNGLASDPEKECQEYEAKIHSFGGIDIQVGGIGSNGHIAFNEPGTPFNQPTHVVSLKESTIKDNARFFDGDMSLVPTQALTIGLKTIADAKHIYILANGSGKAKAIADSVEGNVTTDVPASLLQNHKNATFYCDVDAASLLKQTYPHLPVQVRNYVRPDAISNSGQLDHIHD